MHEAEGDPIVLPLLLVSSEMRCSLILVSIQIPSQCGTLVLTHARIRRALSSPFAHLGYFERESSAHWLFGS